MKKKCFYTILLFNLTIINQLIISEQLPTKLTLKESVNKGVSVSFEYKKARFTDKIYDELMSEYFREYLPKLGVGYSIEEERVERGTDTKNKKIDFSLQQIIYDGGKIGQAREVTKIEKKLNHLEIAEIERTVKLNIVSQFLKLLSIEKKIKIQKEFINNITKELAVADEELKLGEITKLDYLEIKTRSEEERFNLKTLEKDNAVEMSNFKILLKLTPEEKVVLDSDFFEKFKELKNIQDKHKVENLIDLCLLRRKELAKVFLEYKKAEKEYELVRKSYIPTVSLVGTYGLSGETFPPRDKAYSFGIVFNFALGGSSAKTETNTGLQANGRNSFDNTSFNLSVLDNLALYGSQYLEKNLKIYEVINQRDTLRKQLHIEIETQYKNLANSVEAYDIAKKKTEIVRERVRLSQLQVELGELKRIELVKVELEKLKAEQDLINNVMNYLMLGMQLEVKLGVPIGYLELYNLDL